MPELYGSGDDWLAARVLLLVPVVLSLTVHEFAHAWTARALGDDTAERAGRLTLNPLEHIDPVGLLLPLLGIPFGWAKPVPVDPARFSSGVSMEAGLVLTAGAGPLSNLLVAVVATVGMGLWARLDPTAATATGAAWTMLRTIAFLNVLLALFNLLPVPPLDGSRIADGLMPRFLRPAWEAFSNVGPLALLAVLFLPMLAGVSPLAWPMARAHALLDGIFSLLAG